ncbi:putative N-acyltransferase [Kitasatospora sp. MAP12-15]|uniref:GNAT family N-acetyltransferase n=1 Tax=unclassified Kitasatospora TaxID=2633591 RepID=UPI002475BFF0|nr:GNAT family N-acetyltransferase [Kitasatospora sp. MAP12-44]MDH6115198.1 putative N-acyltransferase [Kitasatospora sp. MAP12-44]
MSGVEPEAGQEYGYRVEVLRSIEELPGDLWERLVPADDPMWSRGVFSALEQGRVGPDRYAYLVVRRGGGEVVAVLPLCLFRDLRLDRVVGPRERRLLAPVRRVFPRLLRVPMLFCGNLLGQGHVLAAGPLGAEVGRLLVAAVLEFARRERLGTVVFKDFAAADLDPLRPALAAAGFFLVPSLPDTELPLGEPSFEDYLAGLPAKPRRNARSKIRKFEARSELRIEVLDEFGHLLPQLLALYRQVMDRADQTLDLLDASFLAAVQGGAGLRRRLVVCFEGEQPVAFLLCLFAGSGATGARIGLDYRVAHEARLYHNLHYAAIRLAMATGCRHIRFAQTAYQPKLELGCSLVEQWYAMTHVRPLPRAVLRRLLPPALAAARAEALGPNAPPRTAEPVPRAVPRPVAQPLECHEERTRHATC